MISNLKSYKSTANFIYARVSYWWTWFLMGMLFEIVIGDWTGRYFKIDTSVENFSASSDGRILVDNPSRVDILGLNFGNVLNIVVLVVIVKFTLVHCVYYQMESLDK
jgi:hypothetical protein